MLTASGCSCFRGGKGGLRAGSCFLNGPEEGALGFGILR
jgi:hypothetical protein